MNIALIGFRGTGKTTIGKRLAKRLGMSFVDADAEIVKRSGMSVPEIFASKGEAGFRSIEKEVVAEVSAMDNACIAYGGGAVLAKENIDNLKRNSTAILLEAEPETIHRRIRHDRNRPALTGKDGIEEVKHLLSERENLYHGAAELRFDTTRDSVEETAQKIIAALKGMGRI